MQIPKRIFYVWGYNEPKKQIVNICLENWRMMLPDYEIIEINEKSKEWFDFDYEYENSLWFKTIYDLKMWAYVADYMRVKTLYEHGGIYLDTDVTIYKDFEPLLKDNMFAGMMINNIPELAIVGAQKNNPILKDMYDFYQNEIWHSKEFIIINILDKILKEKYGVIPNKEQIVKTEYISLYPTEYFYPYHYGYEFKHEYITSNTYTSHWQNASWVKKSTLFFMTNKSRLPLPVLLKQYELFKQVEAKTGDKVKLN